MAISNYSDLKTKVASWGRRAGNSTFVAEVPDIITLAEARLNRELPAVETDTTLTGVVSSRRIDISAVSMVEPIALFLAESGLDERQVFFKADGTFPYLVTEGRPKFVAVDGTYLDFDCPLDAAYPFRLRSRNRFALSDSATTNWLLTNHPDIYLAASLMWGAGYREDWPNGSAFKAILDEGIPSVRNIIAQSKRGVLAVDPGLWTGNRGGMSLAEWTNDA
jgi:hypothetical protein